MSRLMPALLLLAACRQQYLAIPNAELVPGTPQYSYNDLWVVGNRPSYGAADGSLAMRGEGSVTLGIGWETTREVKALVFFGLDGQDTEIGAHWRYPLTVSERSEKYAMLTIHLLEDRPSASWCAETRPLTRDCYAAIDEGLDLSLIHI